MIKEIWLMYVHHSNLFLFQVILMGKLVFFLLFICLIVVFLIPQWTWQHTDCRDYCTSYNHSQVRGIQFVKSYVVCYFECAIFSKHIHYAKEKSECPFSFSQFEMVWRLTPNNWATCSCVSFFSIRAALILLPISYSMPLYRLALLL